MSADRPGEGGFTLVELTIAMGLLAVVSTVIITILATFTDTSTGSVARAASAAEAQTAMDRIVSGLRSAVPVGLPSDAIAYATATELRFYAQMNAVEGTAGPRLVDIALNTATGVLTETDTPGVLSGGAWTYSGTSTTTTLANHVALGRYGSTPQLFTYYASTVDPTAAGAATLAVPMSQGGSADSGQIDAIKVDLWVAQGVNGGAGSTGGTNTEAATIIHLENVDLANVPS